MNKEILVVDNLNLFSLIPMLTKFRSTRLIFYLHKTKGILNRIAVRGISKFGWSFEPIRFTLSPVGNISPFKELEKLVIDKKRVCRERLFSGLLNKISNISDYERRRLLTAVGRYAAYELYFPMELYVLLTLKATFKDKIRAVMLRRTPFQKIIGGMYRETGLTPHFYPSLTNGNFYMRENYMMDPIVLKMTGQKVLNFVMAALLLLKSILCKFICVFLNPNSAIKKYTICALTFNRCATEFSNCLPWGPAKTNRLKSRILSLYEYSLPDAAKDFYAKRSSRAAGYSFNPFRRNKEPETLRAWSYFINFFLKNIRLYRSILGLRSLNLWMSKYLLTMLMHMSFFEAFFSVIGAKVLWTMNEDDSRTEMAAVAMARRGGVSLGTTWSHGVLPQWSNQHNQNDIYFTWGARLANIRKHAHDQCDSFVISGYAADKMFAQEFRKASDFRALLSKEYNAKNIVTFIDNISSDDGMIFPENISEVYGGIFGWLNEDSANFLIIKAKRPETLDLPPLLKKSINELCKKRRISIFYEKGRLFPGLVADAIIGVNLTLPFLAAACGRPIVFYDIHNVTGEYPLSLSNAHVIFKANEIRPALRSAIRESQRKGYPEKPQPVRNFAVDPFVDGRASDRMREYIENLLEKLNEGFVNTEAIKYANEQHKKKWGENTVIPGLLSVGR